MNVKTILTLLLFFSLTACSSDKKDQPKDGPTPIVEVFNYQNFDLQAGDLLFQDGDCGSFCEAIEKVTFGIDGARLSHVGMVVPMGTNALAVIEAVEKGVKITPTGEFFNRSMDGKNKSKVLVGRLKKEKQPLIPKAIQVAQSKVGSAYDSGFNMLNDSYYCSELIYAAFMEANGGEPVFELQKMTFKDPDTKATFPAWKTYFKDLGMAIPEDEPGLNPGGMSRSPHVEIVHAYGKPTGYKK
ncbi:MAG: YiiX/YebB-like N1pC/P60 family cysteine hydrolase [Saprospiraceae bacterium]